MSDFSISVRSTVNAPVSSSKQTGEDVKYDSSSRVATRNSELELMRELASGRDELLAALIERHGESIGRLLGRLTAWNGDEDDLLQTVFLRAWQKAGSYQGHGPLQGWLKRIAVNVWRNHQQKRQSLRRKLRDWFLDSRANNYSNPNPVRKELQVHSEVQKALAELQPTDRTILVLFYMEELTGNQIAVHLGIKPETVHVRLHRARQRLKPILESHLKKTGP